MGNVLRISEAASLAMHTAALLAANTDRRLSVHDIAAALGVSENHLSKVLQRLVHAGLVESTRGPKGGFVLAGAGPEMTLLEVYEAIDGPLGPPACLLRKPVCSGRGCLLGNLLAATREAFAEHLGRTTLGELADVYREATP